VGDQPEGGLQINIGQVNTGNLKHVYTSVVALPYPQVVLILKPVIISISHSANSRHKLYFIPEDIKHD